MDQEFKILITGDASGGVRATQQMGDATKKLKIDTSDLSDETKRSLNLIPQLEDDVKKHGRAAVEAGISTREMGHALSDVGNIAAPGAGRALGELRYGPFGAVLALAGAVELLQKYIEDTNKAADELSGKEYDAHQAAVENVKKAWSTAREEMQKYEIALKEAGEEKDPAADHLKRIQEVSAAETAAHLQRVEELNKEYILWLKSHGASPQQIAAAEETARREQEAIKDAAANRSLANTREDIDRRKMRQSDYDATVAAETERVARAQAALGTANQQQQQAAAAGAGNALGKNVTAAQEKLDELEREQHQLALQNPAFASIFDPQIKEAQAKLKAAEDAVKNNDAALDAANKKVEAATAEKNAAEAALHRAEEAGKQNTSRITSETQELGTGRAVEAQKEEDQSKQAILNTQAGRLPMTFEQLAVATGKTHDQIENILAQILAHHLNLVQALNAMAGQFVQQQAQLQQIPYLTK